MECRMTEVTVLPVHGSLSIWAITTVIYMLLILTYLHRTTFLMPSSICWVCIRDVTRQLLITGVGAETMKAAYGVNRADWSYIPGGVSPGTNLIRPDLPELLHFPFLWQEGEYCLGGHATWFMYMVLASNKILNCNE